MGLNPAWNLARGEEMQGPNPWASHGKKEGKRKLQRVKERERHKQESFRKGNHLRHNIISNLLYPLSSEYFQKRLVSDNRVRAQAGRMVVVVLGSSCPTSLLTGECVFSWGKGLRGFPVPNPWPPSPPSARGSRTAVRDFLQLWRTG